MLISQLLNPEPASHPAEHVRTSDASVNSSTLTTAVLPIPTSSTPIDVPDDSNILLVQENVYLNRKTTLVKLFTYTRNAAAVEYPATHAQRPVGHLFEVDPDDWFNPRLNFAYSQGEPSGSRTTENGKAIFCQLLVDTDGNKVPCKVSQFTCNLQAPHEMATRDQLRLRLQESQKLLNVDITQRALFSKTLSLYRAYRVHGCLGPASPSVFPTPPPEDTEDAWLTRLQQIRRGHDAKVTCDGELIFDHDHMGQAFIRCQHFSAHKGGTRDHLFSHTPASGLYDTEYLEALFDNDTVNISRFEAAAKADGYRPLAPCTSISNASSVKFNCPCEHRTVDGELDLAEMVHLQCQSTFRCFEPLEGYRAACPRVLIVCRYSHTHPIPLPTKTPPSIRQQVFSLLSSIEQDLPDLTSRRFLRHSVTRAYLHDHFPTTPSPSLADLHISLANRAHVNTYIVQVQNRCFPLGTGWKGLVHLKSLQDEKMPREDCYIRYMAEIPLEGLPTHDEDDPEPAVSTDRMLRVIICMKPASSRRLLTAQYVQSDIAFKRVAGFLEFELGGLDLSANIAVTYCRVYLNRQTAYAHAFVFKQIEQIVREDTGTSLQWRHLHSDSLEDHVGILQWAGDQHGGQAKAGLGLHLQSIAAALPPRYDLHQTHRLLSSLTAYEHLWRIFRLCRVHVERNIKTSSVPENVKRKMRSLICVTHHDFEGTLRDISKEGGKKGADWVQDKICCKFAFPGICWERSFIPRPIWQVANSTTNVLESLHADVNREGKFCSLVGGVKKGQFFDDMKLRSLEAFERTGVRPSYKSGHKSENISQGLKRSMVARRKTLASEDDNIHTANKRLRSAND
ncbi:hypothetical protein FIBSPDRAFT_768689, partial [Athelia psychrophila]